MKRQRRIRAGLLPPLSNMLLPIFFSMFIAAHFTGCASFPDTGMPRKAASAGEIESIWGVRLEKPRLSANGHLIDFRYRVLDPEKAMNLMRRGDEAYLIDQASGTKLPVPLTRVGRLRSTGSKPVSGRVYTVMFVSGGGIVQRGSAVTVVLGDFRAENLRVE